MGRCDLQIVKNVSVDKFRKFNKCDHINSELALEFNMQQDITNFFL